MTIIEKNTPYWSLRKVLYFLLFSWSVVIIISFTFFHYGTPITKDVSNKIVSILTFLYPALGFELANLLLSSHSKVSPNLVAIVFIVETIGFYFVTLLHYVIVIKTMKYLNIDDYEVFFGFILCVVACFLTDNSADGNYNLYADVIDSGGFFIVKRTLITALLSYFVSVTLCNIHIAMLRSRTQ